MNTLTANPDAARTVAHQLINERVRDAEERRTARAARDQLRTSARRLRQQRTSAHGVSRWSLRFLRPAH